MKFDEFDAGGLYSFDGFTYQGVSGSDMTLGYTLADGVTTGTVTIRYYSDWLSYVPGMYEVGDTLPTVEFVVYNFRDQKIQLDAVLIPEVDEAYQALENTLDAALLYEYTDYTYLMEETTVNGYVINNQYLESVLLAHNENDMYQGIMFDMARFFGALYRATGSTVVVLEYTGIEYTWDAEGTLAGSNWKEINGNTLISTIVSDFVAGTVTNSVKVTMIDALGYSQEIELKFAITMDVNPSDTQTFIETFDAFPETSSSYLDGSFTGVNGVVWTYDGARGDQTLDGKAFTLNRLSNDANASLTATIQGGISSFSVQFYNAFSTGVAVELYINGVLIGTSVTVTDKAVTTFTVENIDIDGEFTIMIKTTNGQLVIDNLTWTTFAAKEEVLVYTDDFGTAAKTGYDTTSFEYTNSNSDTFTLNKMRAQINTSTFEPHNVQGAFIVLAPKSLNLTSYIEYDLSSYTNLSKFEFSISTWSGTAETNIKAMTLAVIKLQVFDTDTSSWVDVENSDGLVNFISNVTSTEYVTVSFNVTEAGLYRVLYVIDETEGTSTSNTAYAVTLDDFKIYETE